MPLLKKNDSISESKVKLLVGLLSALYEVPNRNTINLRQSRENDIFRNKIRSLSSDTTQAGTEKRTALIVGELSRLDKKHINVDSRIKKIEDVNKEVLNELKRLRNPSGKSEYNRPENKTKVEARVDNTKIKELEDRLRKIESNNDAMSKDGSIGGILSWLRKAAIRFSAGASLVWFAQNRKKILKTLKDNEKLVKDKRLKDFIEQRTALGEIDKETGKWITTPGLGPSGVDDEYLESEVEPGTSRNTSANLHMQRRPDLKKKSIVHPAFSSAEEDIRDDINRARKRVAKEKTERAKQKAKEKINRPWTDRLQQQMYRATTMEDRNGETLDQYDDPGGIPRQRKKVPKLKVPVPEPLAVSSSSSYSKVLGSFQQKGLVSSRFTSMDRQMSAREFQNQQEKSQFLKFGALPPGFEHVTGNRGILGKPMAVAAGGAMPWDSYGGTSGGYGGGSSGGYGGGSSGGYGGGSSGGDPNFGGQGGMQYDTNKFAFGENKHIGFAKMRTELFGKEIEDERVIREIAALKKIEVGGMGQSAESDWLESYVNGAVVRKTTLIGRLKGGHRDYWEKIGGQHKVTDAEMKATRQQLRDIVIGGRNRTKGMTDNASAGLARSRMRKLDREGRSGDYMRTENVRGGEGELMYVDSHLKKRQLQMLEKAEKYRRDLEKLNKSDIKTLQPQKHKEKLLGGSTIKSSRETPQKNNNDAISAQQTANAVSKEAQKLLVEEDQIYQDHTKQKEPWQPSMMLGKQENLQFGKATSALKEIETSGKVNQRQMKMAGIRKRPISNRLNKVLQYAAGQSGVEVDIWSGGQRGIRERGSSKRIGSTRHDYGNAADLDLYIRDKDGTRRRLDPSNAADRPIIQKFIRAAASAGATGIGHGARYMRSGRLHVGFGRQSTWGGGMTHTGFNKAFYQGRRNQINLDDVEFGKEKEDVDLTTSKIVKSINAPPIDFSAPRAPIRDMTFVQPSPEKAGGMPTAKGHPLIQENTSVVGTKVGPAPKISSPSFGFSEEEKQQAVIAGKSTQMVGADQTPPGFTGIGDAEGKASIQQTIDKVDNERKNAEAIKAQKTSDNQSPGGSGGGSGGGGSSSGASMPEKSFPRAGDHGAGQMKCWV